MEPAASFSISLDHTIEFSSSSTLQTSPRGSETNEHVFFNHAEVKNPGSCNKKRRRGRKTSNDKTQTVKTTNLIDDGYGWRKYGQKNILKELHPKSYYRCIHQKEENCEAKKWIQQECENPPIYKITYLGHHTCKNPYNISQMFFPHRSPLYSSPENLSVTSPTPILICFDPPKTNDMSNINYQDDKAMKTCDTSSSQSSFSSSLSWSDDSMMLLDDQAGHGIDSFPSIPNPNCKFGSYDLDMMIQVLTHGNVDFM